MLDHTAKGNEAVLECDPGSYCCDTNRPELSGGTNCCDASPNRFSIDGNTEVPLTTWSPAQSSSIVPVSATASSTSIQTLTAAASSTSTQSLTAAADSSTSFVGDHELGQTSCGSIFCATWQYCAFAGQCSSLSITIENESSTPTSESTVSAITTGSSNSIRMATVPQSPTNSPQASSLAILSASASFTPRNLSASSSSIITPNDAMTATLTVTASGTSTAAPDLSVTDRRGFKVGVSIGAVAFLVLLLLTILWCRKRRRSQPYESGGTGNRNPSIVEPSYTPYYGATTPPDPNPYTQSFPLIQLLDDERGPVERRWRSSSPLVPDNHPGSRRPRVDLQHAPPLNPYSVPSPAAAASATYCDQGDWRNGTPAPSYTTESPAVRIQTPRSRLPTPWREPGIQEAPGDGRLAA